MSKERLEEIKAQYHLLTRNGYDLGAWDEPFSWLIEQAECVEELKEVNSELRNDKGVLWLAIEDIYLPDIKRYKQALEFASSELEYAHVTGDIAQKDKLIKDSINVIEKALEREG